MALRYRLTRAAELAEASYVGKKAEVIRFQHKDSLDDREVAAHLLTDHTLLIVGSTSWRDYVYYNARMFGLGRKHLKLSNVKVPVTWHQGFMHHTRVVQDWMDDKRIKPRFIIGHSLGAASTQILSANWNVPAVAFAAPRTCWTANAQRLAPKCLCINRTDDTICELPTSFKHLGNVKSLTPSAPNRGMDHHMRNYRTIVDEGIASGKLPRVWM